jgi:hypothetical protein
MRSQNLPFDIDVWYPRLGKQWTFETSFVPLTRREAAALLGYYETRFLHRPMLTKEDVCVLECLEKRLDDAIRTDFGSDGAFMRLCGRSPKDGEPLCREKLRAQYTDQLLKTKSKYTALARTPYLRVTSGEEAMSLLLTSERVFTDCDDWMRVSCRSRCLSSPLTQPYVSQAGEPEQVVFRRWEPELSLDYEFRAFVCQGALTAITQYDHYAQYPHLLPLKAQIEAKIKSKWAQIHPLVGVTSYCVDFVYLPEKGEAEVIELSPFLPITGPALFNWKQDEAQLRSGPFECRWASGSISV